MAIPRAKQIKKNGKDEKQYVCPGCGKRTSVSKLQEKLQKITGEEETYTLSEVIDMFELYKTGMYAFLADVHRFDQNKINELDLFVMRQARGISKDHTLLSLREVAKNHGVDVLEAFKHTNEVLNDKMVGDFFKE